MHLQIQMVITHWSTSFCFHHNDSSPISIIFQLYTPCLSGQIAHSRSSINMWQIELYSVLELESHLTYDSLKTATKTTETFNKHRHLLGFCYMELLKASFFTLFLKALQSNCLFICVHPIQDISSVRMKNTCVIATPVCCSPVPSPT